jgi:hypothetical protein
LDEETKTTENVFLDKGSPAYRGPSPKSCLSTFHEAKWPGGFRMNRPLRAAAAPHFARCGATLFSSKRSQDVLDGSKFADGGWDRRAPHWVSDRDKRTTTARGVLKKHVLEGELLYGTGLGYTRVRWTPVPVNLGEHAFLAG